MVLCADAAERHATTQAVEAGCTDILGFRVKGLHHNEVVSGLEVLV